MTITQTPGADPPPDPDLDIYFPDYARRTPTWPSSLGWRLVFCLGTIAGRAFVALILRPRREQAGALDPAEVDRVYSIEARTYDSKHHLTTRGQDTRWRRMAGWLAAMAPESCPTVLDLCTGTGLTVMEMVRVLRQHKKPARITGLDYNAAMLERARARFAGQDGAGSQQQIEFARGDATALTGPASAEFQTFPRASFDIVTQVFGIGGINDPAAVIQGALAMLREGGRFLLVDMHRPITALPGEWAVPGKWLRIPEYEAYAYQNITLPLVLARLWGWRDTTLDFYLAPLATEEADGVFYGFRLLWKNVESERWWLSLPVMPTCHILLEKIRIGRAEYDRRQRLFGLALAHG